MQYCSHFPFSLLAVGLSLSSLRGALSKVGGTPAKTRPCWSCLRLVRRVALVRAVLVCVVLVPGLRLVTFRYSEVDY
jgi:hypothetical protein